MITMLCRLRLLRPGTTEASKHAFAAVPVHRMQAHQPLLLKSSCTCSSLQVMHTCWVRDPDERPSFEELKAQLEELWMELRQDDMKRQNQGEAPADMEMQQSIYAKVVSCSKHGGSESATMWSWRAHSKCAAAGFLSKLRSKPK